MDFEDLVAFVQNREVDRPVQPAYDSGEESDTESEEDERVDPDVHAARSPVKERAAEHARCASRTAGPTDLLSVRVFVANRVVHYLTMYRNYEAKQRHKTDAVSAITPSYTMPLVKLIRGHPVWRGHVRVTKVRSMDRVTLGTNDIVINRHVDTVVSYADDEADVYTNVYGAVYLFYVSQLYCPHMLHDHPHITDHYKRLYTNLTSVIFAAEKHIQTYYARYREQMDFESFFLYNNGV